MGEAGLGHAPPKKIWQTRKSHIVKILKFKPRQSSVLVCVSKIIGQESNWFDIQMLYCLYKNGKVSLSEISSDTHLISSVSGTLVYGSMALTLLLSSTGCGNKKE